MVVKKTGGAEGGEEAKEGNVVGGGAVSLQKKEKGKGNPASNGMCTMWGGVKRRKWHALREGTGVGDAQSGRDERRYDLTRER